MRFLADEMLMRLARLLRAAGYDTVLAAGQNDDELLAAAKAENRLLLTRDRKLAARAHPRAVLIAGRGAAAEAAHLAAHVPVDWRLAPFTRCVVDNAELTPATAEQVQQAPDEVRAGGGPFHACPACGRVYWPGSHVKRLQAKLDHLANLSPQAWL